MLSQATLLLAVVLSVAQLYAVRSMNQAVTDVSPQDAAKVETTYDAEKDKTIIRLAPMEI